jgi:hypothetical protein
MGDVRPKYWSYKSTPIPADHPPDIDLGQLMWFFDCSQRFAQRLIETGQVESYKIGEKRRIVYASAERLRERLIARGPQLSPRPVTGKRPVGRPKKQAASSNEAAS